MNNQIIIVFVLLLLLSLITIAVKRDNDKIGVVLPKSGNSYLTYGGEVDAPISNTLKNGQFNLFDRVILRVSKTTLINSQTGDTQIISYEPDGIEIEVDLTKNNKPIIIPEILTTLEQGEYTDVFIEISSIKLIGDDIVFYEITTPTTIKIKNTFRLN
jgi:hypothetical protein